MPPNLNTDDSLSAAPLGSRENPIRCAWPAGQRAYLARVRDKEGLEVRSVRLGSFGMGPYGNLLDGYSITTQSGESIEVYFDMYHFDYTEGKPPPGFRIVA